jgi:hypothetical protein
MLQKPMEMGCLLKIKQLKLPKKPKIVVELILVL